LGEPFCAVEDEEHVSGSSDFGMLLRRHRLAAGLSQEALAERAGISTNGVSALERGYRRTPQRETVTLLATALALSDESRREFGSAARDGSPRDSVPARRRGEAVDDLPIALASFVGRERQLAEIVQLIERGRLVTVTGAGGIGKTQTALHAARALDLPHGSVRFIALASIASTATVASAVAAALNLREVAGETLLDTVAGTLKQKTMVLILDNCEHLMAQASEAAEKVLRECPGVRIIATSREPLRVSGEYRYRLPSLDVPSAKEATGIDAGTAGRYESIALFENRAKAADHSFALTDKNAAYVAEICRRLDGIPLAIELAAARVTLLTVQAINDRLDDRFRLLAGGVRNALPRQQTMRATIDWSYELLAEREKRVFEHLSVFVNGFTLEGAVAVASGASLDELDVIDALTSLVEKSLVVGEPDRHGMRYRMLESSRAYARQKLDAIGAAETTSSRHLSYLRELFAEENELYRRTGNETPLTALFADEVEDVRAALDWAIDHDLTGAAELLVGGRWSTTALVSEGVRRSRDVLRLLPEDAFPLQARLWLSLAWMLFNVRKTQASEAASESVRCARAAGEVDGLAMALCTRSLLDIHASRFDEAESALQEVESLTPTRDALLDRRLHDAKAYLRLLQGDLDAAAIEYEKCGEMRRASGDADGAEHNALNLAEVENARGRSARAVSLASQAAAHFKSSGDALTVLHALSNLCGYLVALDDLPNSRAAGREALELGMTLDRDGIAVTAALEHLALVFALSLDYERAAQLAAYAQQGYERIGYQREPTERKTLDRIEQSLREKADKSELVRLEAVGKTLSADDAIALALRDP
jgi:predicted ATPase/DNA-binding XRE family transcriptional regulator